MLETFTLGTFAPHLGESFHLGLDGGEGLDLTLIEATALSQGGPARSPFSIVFRGPRAPALRQRIYHLEHAQIGPFDLFLVPLGPDASGMRYEAVFA